MLKIIIPLAGSSELFSKAGYLYPKPLIEIKGKPMVQRVIECTNSIKSDFKIVFIIMTDDINKYHLDNTLKLLMPTCEIVALKSATKGGLCSVLMAIDKIEENDSLLILNGDQIIKENFQQILDYWIYNQSDVGVVTFKSVHPRWSYILIENGNVIQSAEKNPISSNAIAGYYYFNSSKTFFDYAFQTIKNNSNIDGQFYISPVINEFILMNKKIDYYEIDNSKYISFYSPKLVTDFEQNYIKKF